MANTIRIKRRSSDSTAPTTSQTVNAELAFNENNDILYYGKGGNSSASSSVIKIGGSGAFLTLDTNQTPTGVKTFSTTTLSITGGSNGNVLTTNGSGTLSWSSVSANAFSNITDGTNTAAASGGDTFKLRATSPLSVTVTNNDATHGDNALFAVAAGSTSSAGILQLTDSTSSTSTTTAATPNSVKSAYDLANAALPKSGGTMTGAITLAADPSSALHAATKQYVDAVKTGLDVKDSVHVASTANISVTYSATGGTSARGQITGATNSIDGVTLVAGDRILLKDQSTGAQNGIWVVTTAGTGSNGVWDRATDFDSDVEVTPGAFTFVEEGTVNADSGWVLTTNAPIVIGGGSGTSLNWAQFSGAGQITAGDGLTKSGNTLNVVTANSGRIVVNADSIDLAIVGYTGSIGSAGINFAKSITVDSYGRVTAGDYADVRTGSTSQTGILQLTDSISSTSTTTAATPASVKSAYDLANAALPKAGGTMTGKVTTVTTSSSTANILLAGAAADPSAPVSGDLWNNAGTLKFYNGSATKTLAFTDSNITGNAANVTGTVAVGNGGTGVTSFTSNGVIYGNGSSALNVTAAGTWDGTNSVGQILSVNASGVPTWTNTVDGGGY
jgi:hypothetical protein